MKYSWVVFAWKSTSHNLGKFFPPNPGLIWLLYNCTLLLSVKSTALECVALSDGFGDRQTMWWSLSFWSHSLACTSYALKFCVLSCCILGSHVLAVADKQRNHRNVYAFYWLKVLWRAALIYSSVKQQKNEILPAEFSFVNKAFH